MEASFGCNFVSTYVFKITLFTTVCLGYRKYIKSFSANVKQIQKSKSFLVINLREKKNVSCGRGTLRKNYISLLYSYCNRKTNLVTWSHKRNVQPLNIFCGYSAFRNIIWSSIVKLLYGHSLYLSNTRCLSLLYTIKGNELRHSYLKTKVIFY